MYIYHVFYTMSMHIISVCYTLHIYIYIFAPSRRWTPRKTWTPPVRWRAFRNVETLANAVRNHTGAWFLQWHPSGPGRRAWTMTMTNPKQCIDRSISLLMPVKVDWACADYVLWKLRVRFQPSPSHEVLPPNRKQSCFFSVTDINSKAMPGCKNKIPCTMFSRLDVFSRYCAFGNSFDKGNCNPRHYLEALGFEV